ncbi:MAG: hypothetical protein OZ948_19650 [Deltaproteobacteria bacterium]|nr:hypothetical protein [Deltaproteobacteria bacterium]
MTLRRYLMLHRREQTSVGDLARDLAADPCARRLRAYESLRAHLEGHGAGWQAIDALDGAHALWREARYDALREQGRSTR